MELKALPINVFLLAAFLNADARPLHHVLTFALHFTLMFVHSNFVSLRCMTQLDLLLPEVVFIFWVQLSSFLGEVCAKWWYVVWEDAHSKWYGRMLIPIGMGGS